MAPNIPDSLLDCDPLPPIPTPAQLSKQSQAARYTVRLRATAVDCKGNLASVKFLQKGFEAQNKAPKK